MISYPNKNISLISTGFKWGAGVLTTLKVFLVMSSAVLFLSVHQPVLAAGLIGKEMEIVQLTNQIRQAQGISMLAVSPQLTNSAQAKANDMATNNYFGHADLAGNRMAYWMQAAGYNYVRAGENLAKGFTDPVSVLNAWTNSPTHYANLINYNYQEIGIGISQGYIDGRLTTFVVQHFGEPMPTITKIFSAELSQPINSAPGVLGDNLNSNPVLDTTAEAMVEVSQSGATAINKSPAGLLWVAYQDAGNIFEQSMIPRAAAADINVGLTDQGYEVTQILFIVLAFLGFWGWLSMLMWPLYAWLDKLRTKT